MEIEFPPPPPQMRVLRVFQFVALLLYNLFKLG